MVERQKKIRDEFPRNVVEYTVENLRDTRTRKVLYTYNLHTVEAAYYDHFGTHAF